jgi:hypothetical protein
MVERLVLRDIADEDNRSGLRHHQASVPRPNLFRRQFGYVHRIPSQRKGQARTCPIYACVESVVRETTRLSPLLYEFCESFISQPFNIFFTACWLAQNES